MIDPYRMIFVNLIGLALVLTGTFIYKFIFPKKSISLFVLLILISILPTISIFRTGVYESGDFNIHLYRTISFYDSLRDGNIMPSWAGELNATYGYPLFIFNYSLPYYVISLFHWLGFSFIESLKTFLALNIVLSGIFMFLFTKKILKNNLAAFTSSVFYVFSPYHLIDVHFKVVIGEILFFTILPLSFLFIDMLLSKKTLVAILLFAFSFAALIMSHVAIALFAGILLLFYIFFHLSKNNLKTLPLYTALTFGISLLISLHSWFGPFLLSAYSQIQNSVLKTVYFPTLKDLLYSPWRMGLLFQGPKGELSYLVGYPHLFIILLLLFFIYRKNVSKKIYSEVLFWLISLFAIIFLILPFSKTLWEHFPVIEAVGSQRLLILVSFTNSILAGYLTLISKKQWIIYLLIATAIGSTILNWGQRRVIPEINDNALKANLWKSTSEGEAHFYANTKWVDMKNPWFSQLPKNHLEIIDGIGNAKNILRTSIFHKYAINAETPLLIQENTLYFPGWKGFVNGKEIALFPSNKGIIKASLPKGNFVFEIRYKDVFVYSLLKMISLLSLLLATIITIAYAVKFRIN